MPIASWLITGATDGIGLALLQALRAGGQPVLSLGCRPLAELEPALFGEDNYCAADLADTDCANTVCRFLDQRGVVSLRGLIHNAALGWTGAIADQSADSIEALVRVNLLAPIHLSQALWGRTERIVFVSSVVADFAAPRYAVYAAGKKALNSLAANLRAENDGPVVQTLHLGAVRTQMHAKSGLHIPAQQWRRFTPPQQAARWVVRKLASNRPNATMGWKSRLIRYAGRLAQAPLTAVARWP
jgi:short-subunit dehydrogenase